MTYGIDLTGVGSSPRRRGKHAGAIQVINDQRLIPA